MKLLKQLCNAYGVSGSEKDIRKLIINRIRNYVDGMEIDSLGNLIAWKKGKEPRIMLAAHMDEVGLMVKGIGSTGKLSFSVLGGIDPLVLVGQKVVVQSKSGNINGVITLKGLSDSREIKECPVLDDLRVDIGLDREEVFKRGVCPGDYLSLEQGFFNLANKDMVSSKALDDRVGCYVLLELAKKLSKIKNEMYYVFTVQEELGLYGAKTSAYQVNPDWAIAVDVTNADDFDLKYSKKLGDGPSITIKDAEMISNKCINQWLIDVARKNKIPFQLDVGDLGTTDARSITLSKAGIPSTVVGVPVRNLHSTISIASFKDVENCIKLLELLLKKPPKVCEV